MESTYSAVQFLGSITKCPVIPIPSWICRHKDTSCILFLTLKDGHEKYDIIDAKFGVMIANRDQLAFHPDIDETEAYFESSNARYRSF